VTPLSPPAPVSALHTSVSSEASAAAVSVHSVTIQTYAPGGKAPPVQTVEVGYQAFDAKGDRIGGVPPMKLTGSGAASVVAAPMATQLSVAEAQVVAALQPTPAAVHA
jgi:hypothetical protein